MLRPYQIEALNALRTALKDPASRPLVLLPTGAGKGFILGEIASGIASKGSRMIVLAHVKELVEQNAKQCERGAPNQVGIYSAGLGERCTNKPIICAGIQSVYKKACDIGKIDIAICDEAHLRQPDDEGMYGKFFETMLVINLKMRIIGLTATPYRLGTGKIYGEGRQFTDICYRVSVLDLIAQGYLSPLTSKAPSSKIDFSGLHRRNGDFIPAEAEQLMDGLVQQTVADLVTKSALCKSILVFASGVEHAGHLAHEIRRVTGQQVEVVVGDTPSSERADFIAQFKAGTLRWLVNVGVLTTGFDAPNVDCVAIVRPTDSPGLLYQMVGRGFRLAPEKKMCTVLDYGGNIERHGPVDKLDLIDIDEKKAGSGPAPVKECPECHEYVHAAVRECPSCKFAFPPPEKKHESRAHSGGVLSSEVEIEDLEVVGVRYEKHLKKGSDGENPTDVTMRVIYRYGIFESVSEWICFNHQGYARAKAEAWWKARSISLVPKNVDQALYLADEGFLAKPIKIRISKQAGSKYPTLISIETEPIDDTVFVGKNKLKKEEIDPDWE